VAYYPLDHDADDASGNGHHGNVMGGAQAEDGGFRFGGSGGYVVVPSSKQFGFGEGVFTLALWFKTTAQTGVGTTRDDLLARGDPTVSGFSLSLRENRPTILVGDDGELSGGAALNDGTWHHLAGVRDDRGTLTMYIDGVPIASFLAEESVNSSTRLFIGRHGTKQESYFNGLLDEIWIYDQELAEEDIKAMFDARR